MKSLVSTFGTFGPFFNITKEADHYLGDGTVFPFAVVGDNCIITDYVLPTPTPTVPVRVRRKYLRLALLEFGYYEALTTYIKTQATPKELIEWEDSEYYDRTNSLLVTGAAKLGLNVAAVDAVFIRAEELKVEADLKDATL